MEEEEIREKLEVIFPEAIDIRFNGNDKDIMGCYVHIVFPNERIRDEQVEQYTSYLPEKFMYTAYYPPSSSRKLESTGAAGEPKSNAGIILPKIDQEPTQRCISLAFADATAQRPCAS